MHFKQPSVVMAIYNKQKLYRLHKINKQSLLRLDQLSLFAFESTRTDAIFGMQPLCVALQSLHTVARATYAHVHSFGVQRCALVACARKLYFRG